MLCLCFALAAIAWALTPLPRGESYRVDLVPFVDEKGRTRQHCFTPRLVKGAK